MIATRSLRARLTACLIGLLLLPALRRSEHTSGTRPALGTSDVTWAVAAHAVRGPDAFRTRQAPPHTGADGASAASLDATQGDAWSVARTASAARVADPVACSLARLERCGYRATAPPSRT